MSLTGAGYDAQRDACTEVLRADKGRWWTVTDMTARLGVSRSRVGDILNALVRTDVAYRMKAGRSWAYRWWGGPHGR